MHLDRSTHRCAAGIGLVAAALLTISTLAQEVRPPAIRFTTEEAFDAASVPPYAGKHDEVYKHIEANIQGHVSELQRWVRQPSVSAQNRGIAEMAKLLADDLRTLGFKEVAIVPTSGHPGCLGSTTPACLNAARLHDVRRSARGDWLADARLRRHAERHRARPCADGQRRNEPERAGARVSERARFDHQGRRETAGQPARRGRGRRGAGVAELPRGHREVRSPAEEGRWRVLPLQRTRPDGRRIAAARRQRYPLDRAGDIRRSQRRADPRRDPQLAEGDR